MTKWAIILSSTLFIVSLGLVLQLWAVKSTFDAQANQHDQVLYLLDIIIQQGAN